MPQSQSLLESHGSFCNPASVQEYVTIEAGPDGKQISKTAQGFTQATATKRALLFPRIGQCLHPHAQGHDSLSLRDVV